MITDGITAVQAFEAGEVDVLYQALPPAEISRLKETPEYEQYPGLGTYYYGVQRQEHPRREAASGDVARDPAPVDHRQHRAGRPAARDRVHARGHAGLRRDQPGVAVAAGRAGHGAGEAADGRGRQPEEEHHALHQRLPAPTARSRSPSRPAWKEIGIDSTIKQQEFQQYLEFLGPPPNKDVDVYRLGWIGDFVDAINFLELWTCDSGNNSTNYCNKEYDALIEKARGTEDNDARYEIYGQARTSSAARTATCPSPDLLLHVHEPRAGERQGDVHRSTCSTRST